MLCCQERLEALYEWGRDRQASRLFRVKLAPAARAKRDESHCTRGDTGIISEHQPLIFKWRDILLAARKYRTL